MEKLITVILVLNMPTCDLGCLLQKLKLESIKNVIQLDLKLLNVYKFHSIIM